MSYLRSETWPLRTQPCDICWLCREVVENQSELTGRQIDLKCFSSSLEVDDQRLSLVVINLIANAIKYSPVNTVIQVEVNQHPSEIILTVHNDDSILSPALQEAIFDPFYRAPDARMFSTYGSGMGLAICKEIVEQHGGRIWVESSEEKGTTFLVLLPKKNNQ